MRVNASLRKPLGVSLVAVVFLTFPATAAATESHFAWPAWSELVRLLTLQDYNTRVVILGTTLLGFAAGLAGTFLILRKRALLSDALSHATLPGIALAFILMSMVLGQGKYLLGLIAGAAIFSVLGTVSVLLIQRYSRLKDDAALGIVLSVYFGLGIALMGFATRMQSGGAAGLSSFIYGKTASMLLFDATLIAISALLAALGCRLRQRRTTRAGRSNPSRLLGRKQAAPTPAQRQRMAPTTRSTTTPTPSTSSISST